MTKEVQAPTASEALAWLKEQYPHGVDLVYIDYCDSIESAGDREKILQAPDEWWDILDGDGWIFDNKFQAVDTIVREYSERGEGEAYEITDETRDAMQDWLIDHDTSNPIKDLLKNTGREYMYYDTGLSFESLDYASDKDKEVIKRAKTIAKKLRVDYAKHGARLCQMVGQAWYGGQVVILFENTISNFLENAKFIKFSGDAEVCLMDRGGGSGDSVKLSEKMLFNFKRENIHTDKGDNGYSYAYDTCGLVGGIMEDGVLTNKGNKARAIKIETNEEREALRARENKFIVKIVKQIIKMKIKNKAIRIGATSFAGRLSMYLNVYKKDKKGVLEHEQTYKFDGSMDGVDLEISIPKGCRTEYAKIIKVK